jgi:hypothetical protein
MEGSGVKNQIKRQKLKGKKQKECRFAPLLDAARRTFLLPFDLPLNRT